MAESTPNPSAPSPQSASPLSARERAEQYKQDTTAADEAAQPSPVRTPKQWSDLISQRIEEAMQAGAFDNLPGKGKPLQVGPEPFVSADMQMANSLLKNNALTPAWISERKEMLTAIEQFRARLATAAEQMRRAMDEAAAGERREALHRQWHGWVERFRREAAELNRRIQLYNLKQPITSLEIYKLQMDAELKEANAPTE